MNDEDSTDKCVEELTSAIQVSLAVSDPKRRMRGDRRPLLPVNIQDETRLKNQLKRD